MTSHILEVFHRRQQEVLLAKTTLTKLPEEVAHIVFYNFGSDIAHLVRFVDMKDAKRKYEALVKAREAQATKPFVLTGSNATAYITNPHNISVALLVDVQANNHLMADTQKRMNARVMATP